MGSLALEGVDIRAWDLNQMLAAFEATIRRSAKDESDAKRTLAALAAEPIEVRKQRREAERAGRVAPGGGGRMTVDDAESMLARFAAAEAAFG